MGLPPNPGNPADQTSSPSLRVVVVSSNPFLLNFFGNAINAMSIFSSVARIVKSLNSEVEPSSFSK